MEMKEQLSASVALAEEHGLFRQLNAVYERIPQGRCAGCTRCCAESVHVFYIEFINIFRWLSEQPRLYETLKPRLEDYWMHEMVRRMPCPFLDAGGRCEIYPVRPLVCRQFGHWSRRDFEKNIQAVRQENRSAARYYQETYGLSLPEEVVEYGLPYCEDFEVEKKMTARQRLEQSDSIFMLDVPFLQEGLLDEDQMGTPLVSWFVYLTMTPEDAGKQRLDVMREYLKNR